MKGYTKLHGKIVHSSIWREPNHVRILWVTMLAMADQDGVVESSVGGLADVARLSVEECKEALSVLLSPDPDSSDGTTGERIMRIPLGWLVLNHSMYRDRQTRQQAQTAERVRRHRERKRQGVTLDEVTSGSAPKRAPASASASVSASPRKSKRVTIDRPDDVAEQLWTDWVNHRRVKSAVVSRTVIDTLRREAGKAKLNLSQVMTLQVANGWQGFRAEWMAGAKGRDAIGQATAYHQKFSGQTFDEDAGRAKLNADGSVDMGSV